MKCDFDKYLQIDYNTYQHMSSSKSFVWGWDLDIFLKNTFAHAYFSRNTKFIRDIKLSILLDQLPDFYIHIINLVDKNPPIATAILPSFHLNYLYYNKLNIQTVIIKTSNKIEIDPQNDWIIHSFGDFDTYNGYYFRYAIVPKMNWCMPTEVKRDIQLKKLGI